MSLAERSKVKVDRNFSIAIVSLGLTYQVRLKTLAPTLYKINFSKISNLNALESKSDLDVKKVKVNL